MATFLYRLGRGAFRRRGLVALLWVALLFAAGFGAASAAAPTSGSFSIPGSEAQKAFDLLDERFPGMAADGATARIVIKAPEGAKVTDPGPKAEVQKIVSSLKTGPGAAEISSVADPYEVQAVSQDGSTAYISAKYTVSGMELKDDTREALKGSGEAAKAAGLNVQIGGDALMAAPETGSGEIIGIAVAAIVLVITFGSLIAAGLPLLTAIIGVGIGVSSITALANVLDLGNTTATLATMIGLAVGIDYALFIVSRYRVELAEGRERDEAAYRAVGTAGFRRRLRRSDRGHRPGGPGRRQPPHADQDGLRGRGHRGHRRARRADPGPGHPRLRGQEGAARGREEPPVRQGQAAWAPRRRPTAAPAGPASSCAAPSWCCWPT